MERFARNAVHSVTKRMSGGSSQSSTSSSASIGLDISNYHPEANSGNATWDIFMCYNRETCASEAEALYQHLTHGHAVNVWYTDEVTRLARVEEGVRQSKQLLFFASDGVFEQAWCLDALRWAVQYNKPIVVAYSHRSGGSIRDLTEQVPPAMDEDLLLGFVWIKCDLRAEYFRDSITKLLKQCSLSPSPEAGRDAFEAASSNSTVTPKRLSKLYQQGTRKWLFAAVNKWHHARPGDDDDDDDDWLPVYVVTGDAGAGKSVFASQLCVQGSHDFVASKGSVSDNKR
jgi:hypothetical protein